MGFARVDVNGSNGLASKHEGNAEERNEPLLASEVGVEITRRGTDIEFLECSFATDHDPDEALLDVDMGFVEVSVAGAVTGTEPERLSGFIEEQQRTHLCLHQQAGLPGNHPERIIEVQGGVNGVADADQGLEEPRLESELLVKPGVVDDFGGLVGQLGQQFLVGRSEGFHPFRVHVEDAADFAIDLERHGELGSHVRSDGNVTGVGPHVTDSSRPAGARHPAGDPLAHPEAELGGRGGDAASGLDFEELGGGIDEGDRAARGAHDADGFIDDQPQNLVGFEGRVNDLAHLIQESQALVARVEIDAIHRTRLVRMIPATAKSPFGSQPARNGCR